MITTLGARDSLRGRRVWLAAILAAAVALAIFHYVQFLQNPRVRWNGIGHDRSGHYQFAQDLALAARSFEPVAFFSALEKAKVWPPVHALCAAAVLTFGGIDYRLAVLPSLVGWIITAVFGFLLARRCCPAHGNVAGLIAASFILASPAYRLYALDIMLESLGAALTLMAIYFYAVARAAPSWRTWRWFSLTLTVLFFEKYNYWLLVLLALVANELIRLTTADWKRAILFLRRRDWAGAILTEGLQPLNWLCGIIACAALIIFILHPAPVSLAGKSVSLYPPNNLVTLAYAAFFFRCLRAIKWRRLADPALHQLALWHALPIAVSFLLPRRLSSFVWFLGPLNTGEKTGAPLADAGRYYLHSIATDYHAAPWSAALALLFFVLAILVFRRLNAGGRAVVLLVVLSALLTISHPNQKSRFLHSWLAPLWVAGAIGLTNTLSAAGRWRGPLAWSAGAILVLTHVPAMLQPGRAPERGGRGETTSLLDISDTYLPELGHRRVAIFSSVPAQQFLLWTYRDRYPHSGLIEFPLRDYPLSAERVRARITDWEKSTQAEAVVFIDFGPDSEEYLPLAGDHSAYESIAPLINSDPRFSFAREWHLPRYGCTISLWNRR